MYEVKLDFLSQPLTPQEAALCLKALSTAINSGVGENLLGRNYEPATTALEAFESSSSGTTTLSSPHLRALGDSLAELANQQDWFDLYGGEGRLDRDQRDLLLRLRARLPSDKEAQETARFNELYSWPPVDVGT